MRQLMLTLFLVIGLLQASDANSQGMADTSVYRVRTTDGNEYFGRILSRDSVYLFLKTDKLGELRLRNLDISSIEKIESGKMVEGSYWGSNPQATRYFWSPNGYGLRKGEGYYQNVWLFFNQVAVGVTDHFSIGAGMVPLFMLGGAPTPVWVSPKVSVPVVKDKFNVGAGVLAGYVIGFDESENENGSFGILYGSTTFGSRDRNVSLGLGWGYGGGEIANTPTVNFSLMHRTSSKWYLLSENYYIDGGGDPLGILSFGARYMPKNLALDFGLFSFFGPAVGTFVALPWLGVSVQFGKKK